MLIEGRTEAQINRAKREQMYRLGHYGARPGQRKKCKRGKSCGAACIVRSMVCMVDIPWALSPGLSSLAKAIHTRKRGETLVVPPKATKSGKRDTKSGKGATGTVNSAKPPAGVSGSSATTATPPSPQIPESPNSPTQAPRPQPQPQPQSRPRKQEMPPAAVFLLRQLVEGLERHEKAMREFRKGYEKGRGKTKERQGGPQG